MRSTRCWQCLGRRSALWTRRGMTNHDAASGDCASGRPSRWAACGRRSPDHVPV
jgi:hypothetical protein